MRLLVASLQLDSQLVPHLQTGDIPKRQPDEERADQKRELLPEVEWRLLHNSVHDLSVY